MCTAQLPRPHLWEYTGYDAVVLLRVTRNLCGGRSQVTRVISGGACKLAWTHGYRKLLVYWDKKQYHYMASISNHYSEDVSLSYHCF